MAGTAQKFTKDDFLNAAALVKKLSTEYGTTYDLESVKTAMESEYRKKTQIKNNTNIPTMLIYDAKWTHRRSLRLHPLGLKQFKQILDKGK